MELELGSVSKELETINADKLDLLTSKVKINKGVYTSDMLQEVSILVEDRHKWGVPC